MADSAVIVLIRYQLPINFNELDIILKSYCYDFDDCKDRCLNVDGQNRRFQNRRSQKGRRLKGSYLLDYRILNKNVYDT